MLAKAISRIKVVGSFEATLRQCGYVKHFAGKNLVVTQGLQKLAALCLSATTQPKWMAIGDGAAAVAMAQVALQGSEWQRILMTQAQSGNALVLTGTITGAVAQRNVQEMGVFSASTGNTLFSRFLPTAFDLEVGGELDITWQLEFS